MNRPGNDGTSEAVKSGPVQHIQTVCEDAVVVLDALGIAKVSLLCQCAGRPFALAFQNKFPDRTTKHLTGIGPPLGATR
jgi:hypothetical protein